MLLLLRGSVARHLGGSGVLGSGKISGDGFLVDGVHHYFKKLTLAAGVELKRLVDGAVFLFDLFVFSQNVKSELALLGICLLELKADDGEMGWVFALLQGELKVVTITAMLQELQFIMRGGNQFTMLGQVANGMLQLAFGGGQIIARICDVRANLGDIAFYAADFAGNFTKLFLGGFFVGNQAGFGGLLRNPNVSGFAGEFLVRHADFISQHVNGSTGLAAKIIEFLGNVLLLSNLVLLQFRNAALRLDHEDN